MIVTDASVWVSIFYHDDANRNATRRWLKRYLSENGKMVAPMLLVAEVSGAMARRTALSRLGHRALRRLVTDTSMRLVPMDDSLVMVAAELAADCRLRGADALYVALAYTLNVPLLTWDQEQIARVQGVIQAGTPTTLFGNDAPGNLR
jgi:predicted nucleic acid-binding protein